MRNKRKVFTLFISSLLLVACKDSALSIEKREIILNNKIDSSTLIEEHKKIKEKYEGLLNQYASSDFEVIDRVERIDTIKQIYPDGVEREEKAISVSNQTVQYDKDNKLIRNIINLESIKNSKNKEAKNIVNYDYLYKSEGKNTYSIDLVMKTYAKVGTFNSILNRYAHYLGYIESFNPNTQNITNYEYYFDNDILSIVTSNTNKDDDKIIRESKTIIQMTAYDQKVELYSMSNVRKYEYNDTYTKEINNYEYRIKTFEIKNVKLKDMSIHDFIEE